MITISQSSETRVSKIPQSAGHIIAKYRDEVGDQLADSPINALDALAISVLPDDWEWALHDAVRRWLHLSCRSAVSVRNYTGMMKRWVAWSGHRSLAWQMAVKSATVMEYLQQLKTSGLSDRTIGLARDVVGSWFGWLVSRNLLVITPVSRLVRRSVKIDHMAVRKGDGMRQALTKTEAQAVANWATHEAAPVAGFSVLAQMIGGLRSIEVTRLNIDHITDKDGVVTLTVRGKGNRTRRVILEEIAARAWRRYAEVRPRRPGPALVSRGGKAFTTTSVQNWAKEAAKVVGRQRDISSHDLRKTAATLLMDAGATLDEVQRHLGHSSPILTSRCYVTRRRQMVATTGVV